MKSILYYSLLCLFIFFIFACDIGINRTIYIGDGETKRGDINSVNGSIIIGKECKVLGSSRTVNGRIEVGKQSQVEDLQSVNGGIQVDDGVRVAGDIETVNGGISCGREVEIAGGVKTINGKIRLFNTLVSRNVKTINGEITLEDQSRVRGDIVIEGKRRGFEDWNKLRIKIKNSLVEGDIRVEDADANVLVYLSDGGKVMGKIEHAEVIHE